MIVDNVVKVSVHFKNGKYIDFDASEIGLQLVRTEVKNEDGTEITVVEYYIITTGMVQTGGRHGTQELRRLSTA
jgi:hypothetical protein